MRRLALAAALLLGGCIDFKEITEPRPEPPPPPEVAPEFHANILFEDSYSGAAPGEPSTRGGVRVHAILNPGRGASGEPRPIGDDTLRVSGSALVPTRVEGDGTRLYEGWVPLPAEAEAGLLLAVSPPAVARQAGWPPVIFQPIPRRIGPDTLEAASGGEVSLSFSLPSPPPGGQPLDQGWYLEIAGGETQIIVSGAGAPPNPLVVPLGLIPRGSGVPLSARLHLNTRTGLGDREGGGYFIEIVMSASLRWVVRRWEGTPAG